MDKSEAYVKSISCCNNIVFRSAPWILLSPAIYLVASPTYAMLSAFVGVYIAISSLVYQLSTQIHLTTHRIEYASGFVTRIKREIRFEDINSVVIRSRIFESRIGMADVLIKAIKGRDIRIMHLSKADAKKINDRYKTSQQRAETNNV